MANASKTGAYTMREIADYFGVRYMTVSRAVKRHEPDNHHNVGMLDLTLFALTLFA